MPEQRLAELSELQEEISRAEAGVNTLDGIVRNADMGVCGPAAEQNIRQVLASLQQQAAAVEKTASVTRDLADQDLARSDNTWYKQLLTNPTYSVAWE